MCVNLQQALSCGANGVGFACAMRGFMDVNARRKGNGSVI
jgi:hypothetical protein